MLAAVLVPTLWISTADTPSCWQATNVPVVREDVVRAPSRSRVVVVLTNGFAKQECVRRTVNNIPETGLRSVGKGANEASPVPIIDIAQCARISEVIGATERCTGWIAEVPARQGRVVRMERNERSSLDSIGIVRRAFKSA